MQLQEMASIGLLDGPETSILGRVVAIHAHGDRIYVIDQKPMITRVYDQEGRFLFDIGGHGGGPGEYIGPASIVVNPLDGTIFLRDAALSRINLYDSSGEYRESWRLQIGYASFDPLVFTADGRLFTVLRLTQPAPRKWIRSGMVQVTHTGSVGDTLEVPAYAHDTWIIEFGTPDGLLATVVPYSPEVVWAMSPTGAMLSGVSDEYRILVQRQDGESLIIERVVAPISLQPDERDWHLENLTRSIRSSAPGWTWSRPNLPKAKPFFDAIIPDDTGRIWVIRRGMGDPAEDVVNHYPREVYLPDDITWKDRYFADVYEEGGRFLGSVDLPEGFLARVLPSITGDDVHLLIAGDVGELMVKRFRLVSRPN